jgi:hypothetical protein
MMKAASSCTGDSFVMAKTTRLMPNPRRSRDPPTIKAMARINADLSARNAQLTADNSRMAATIAKLQTAPHYVPIKAADARGYSTETVRRWCHRGLVKHRWDGMRLLVDQTDLTARCDRLTGNT